MSYVAMNIIPGLKARQGKDKFNYHKLIKLLEQLDTNYDQSNEYGCYLLIKAILNHIPPLLGYPDFDSMASSYGWSSASHRSYALYLKQVFIEETHDATHTRISGRQDQLTLDSITNVQTRINTILEECLANTVTALPNFAVKQQPAKNTPKTKIILTDDQVAWANYASFGPSFLAKISINNFDNNKINYVVKAVLSGTNGDGTPYNGESFKFADLKAGERLKIEPNEIKDTVITIADEHERAGIAAPYPMPDLDRDTIKLTFYFADGSQSSHDMRGIRRD